MNASSNKNWKLGNLRIISKAWELYDYEEGALLFGVNLCGVMDEELNMEIGKINFLTLTLIDNMTFDQLSDEPKEFVNNFLVFAFPPIVERAEKLLCDLQTHTPKLVKYLKERNEIEFFAEFKKCHKKIQKWLINGLKEKEILLLPNELLLNPVCDKLITPKQKTTKSNKNCKSGKVKKS